ncbi:MAG: hypothetical protein ACOYKD_03565 [Anaerolineaceae bacterium]
MRFIEHEVGRNWDRSEPLCRSRYAAASSFRDTSDIGPEYSNPSYLASDIYDERSLVDLWNDILCNNSIGF